MDLSELRIRNIVAAMEIGPTDKLGFIPIDNVPTKHFDSRIYHGLVLTTSGKTRYVVEDRYVLEADAGTLLYLPERKRYYVQILVPCLCYCVNFHLFDNMNYDPFILHPHNPSLYENTFKVLIQQCLSPKPSSNLRSFALLYEMLSLVEEERRTGYMPSQKRELIENIASRMIARSCTEEFSIASLADECGISVTYFRRLFQKMYGMSPKQYQIRSRMRMAKALLVSTGMQLCNIALICGFDNVYYFSRAFHNSENVSPSDYRKQHCRNYSQYQRQNQ